jgi:hypothetical protein
MLAKLTLPQDALLEHPRSVKARPAEVVDQSKRARKIADDRIKRKLTDP